MCEGLEVLFYKARFNIRYIIMQIIVLPPGTRLN